MLVFVLNNSAVCYMQYVEYKSLEHSRLIVREMTEKKSGGDLS